MDESKFGQPGQPEQKKPKIELDSAQQKAVESIISELQNPTEAPFRVILLEGLSGTGKTAVLDSLADQISQYKAIKVDPQSHHYVLEDIKEVKKETKARSFISSISAGATEEIVKKLNPSKAQIKIERLQGMSEEETKKLVEFLAAGRPLNLPVDKIVEYSMGVPLLVHRLMHSEVTEELAAVIASRYLDDHTINSGDKWIRPSFTEYLKMPIPEEVKKAPNSSFNHQLGIAVRGWEKFLEEDKKTESPFFIAPESMQIYKEMFGKNNPDVEIYARDLSVEDQARFRKSFPSRDSWEARNSRLEMFGGEYRKVRIELNGKLICDTEGWAESKYFPQKNSPNSAYFQKHDHMDSPYATAIDCWAVESFLQQRGIAYEVFNRLYGKNYRFNPATKHIEIIEDISE